MLIQTQILPKPCVKTQAGQQDITWFNSPLLHMPCLELWHTGQQGMINAEYIKHKWKSATQIWWCDGLPSDFPCAATWKPCELCPQFCFTHCGLARLLCLTDVISCSTADEPFLRLIGQMCTCWTFIRLCFLFSSTVAALEMTDFSSAVTQKSVYDNILFEVVDHWVQRFQHAANCL